MFALRAQAVLIWRAHVVLNASTHRIQKKGYEKSRLHTRKKFLSCFCHRMISTSGFHVSAHSPIQPLFSHQPSAPNTRVINMHTQLRYWRTSQWQNISCILIVSSRYLIRKTSHYPSLLPLPNGHAINVPRLKVHCFKFDQELCVGSVYCMQPSWRTGISCSYVFNSSFRSLT